MTYHDLTGVHMEILSHNPNSPVVSTTLMVSDQCRYARLKFYILCTVFKDKKVVFARGSKIVALSSVLLTHSTQGTSALCQLRTFRLFEQCVPPRAGAYRSCVPMLPWKTTRTESEFDSGCLRAQPLRKSPFGPGVIERQRRAMRAL